MRKYLSSALDCLIHEPLKQLGLIHLNYSKPYFKEPLYNILLNRTNKSFAKFCFYSSFVFFVDTACKLSKLVSLQSYIITELLSYSLAALVGAILQGRPDCHAQQDIERKPFVAALAGMANGLMCCLLYTNLVLPITTALIAPLLPILIPAMPLLLPTLLAQTAFALFASWAMCKLETNINGLDIFPENWTKEIPSKAPRSNSSEKEKPENWAEKVKEQVSEEQKAGGCCCHSASAA